jgi:hypothetical protein
MNYFNHSNSVYLNTKTTILAQNTPANQDIGLEMKDAWNHFVITGQCWALLIGVVLGYALKSLTKFG